MRVLITTARMPSAIDEIRKLGRSGHTVVAADTFRSAPGTHSKYVAKSLVVPSPRYEPDAFVEAIGRAVEEFEIDLVLPAFEEVLYLARGAAALPRRARYFFSPFEIVETFHDKVRLLEVAREIGVPAPRSVLVTSRADLERAAADTGDYFAKPVYSRGGVYVMTNRGPLAGARDASSFSPSQAEPWVVQEYLDGLDVCTFSVARHGRVVAHACYVHPREIEHAGGIVFESIDDPDALEYVRRFVEWGGYDGQIGFDFRRTSRGLSVIECNPRPTAGVHLMSEEIFLGAIEGNAPPVVVPAGISAKYSLALLRDMVLHGREAFDSLKYLFSAAREVIADPDDIWPAAYQVVSYGVVQKYRRKRPKSDSSTDLMEAYFDDVCWNGRELAKAA
jgi:predicted ATP-grasp superfamily ATP-dependent carboligase